MKRFYPISKSLKANSKRSKSQAGSHEAFESSRPLIETFEKCSILAKVKEGENFNHRNMFNISRIEI